MTSAKASRVPRTILHILILLLFCPTTFSKLIYVDDDAAGANGGTSWTNAYRHLQDALADAESAEKPVEIRVAQGIYKPDRGAYQTLDDREATFQLMNGVTLKGGYAGFGEPDPNARDTRFYEAILSGEIGKGRTPTRKDNTYHVLTAQELDGTVIVDGFTITGGNADGFGLLGGGGGILNNNGRLTIVDCRFRGNSARLGGGIYNRNGDLLFMNCKLTANNAFQWGGGICNDQSISSLTNCIFGGNNAGFGGGVYDVGGNSTLLNCTLYGNSAFQGSGLYGAGPIYTKPQTYQVTRRFSIQNETARINRLKVWLPMPMECDSQRGVRVELIQPHSSNVWKQLPYGSEVSYWDLNEGLKTGETLTIEDQFFFTCYEVNHVIDPATLGAYEQDDPVVALYKGAGKFLEASDPAIVQTAMQIVGEETNPYIIAYSIYEWVINHMTYQQVAGLKGAKFALDRAYGECGDYSALFVALCRAAGIPARPVVGRWALSSPDNWHVWAEFYLPGHGWIPVDPTVADDAGRLEDHFGHLDNRRLIFNKTYNVVLYPTPQFFSPNVGFMQTSYWEYHGRSGVTHVNLDYTIRPVASATAGFASGEHRTEPIITNCIVWGSSSPQISGNAEITYSDIQGGWPGEGNVDVDPLFAIPGYMNTNGTPEYVNDDFGVDGDYHLMSESGRWDSYSQTWIIDNATSPCVDAGNPRISVDSEPFPNGTIINMGAYGGTAEASKSPSGVHATKYNGGTGRPDDPFQIATAQDLMLLGDSLEDYHKHFILITDVDLDPNLPGRRIFDKAIIAPDTNNVDSDFQGTSFSGVFDGNGHTISHLTIVGDSYLGLFGRLASGAMVSNLSLEAAGISGSGTYIGGIVGFNEGSITTSHGRGTMTGNRDVGGLVGYNYKGCILNCYSEGSISGRYLFGGLVGYNSNSNIIDCHSTCSVKVGDPELFKVHKLYVLTENGVVELSSAGEPRILVDLKNNSHTFKMRDDILYMNTERGGDIIAYDLEGHYLRTIFIPPQANDYRTFVALPDERFALLDNLNDRVFFINNNGNLIATTNMQPIGDKHLQNIDGIAVDNRLIISEDGDRHVLAVDLTDYTTSIFRDFNRYGGLPHGLGAIAYNNGTYYICGPNTVHAFTDSGSPVQIAEIHDYNITGIVVVEDCLYLCANFGGKVYEVNISSGEIRIVASELNYPRGVEVSSSNRYMGGFVGNNCRGDVVNCFWDTETSGQSSSDVGIGLTTAEMQTAGTFLEAGWDFVDETDNGTGDIWWILEGQDYPRLWWELIPEN